MGPLDASLENGYPGVLWDVYLANGHQHTLHMLDTLTVSCNHQEMGGGGMVGALA